MNLTSEKINNQELLLTKRRDALVAMIKSSTHKSESPELLVLGNLPPDVGDRVAGDVLNDIDIALVTAELAELSDVEAALLRIRDGSYGVCHSCGKEIPFERMQAQPAALRCIGCQEEVEKPTHMAGVTPGY